MLGSVTPEHDDADADASTSPEQELHFDLSSLRPCPGPVPAVKHGPIGALVKSSVVRVPAWTLVLVSMLVMERSSRPYSIPATLASRRLRELASPSIQQR